jgi:hypothetical protein
MAFYGITNRKNQPLSLTCAKWTPIIHFSFKVNSIIFLGHSHDSEKDYKNFIKKEEFEYGG